MITILTSLSQQTKLKHLSYLKTTSWYQRFTKSVKPPKPVVLNYSFKGLSENKIVWGDSDQKDNSIKFVPIHPPSQCRFNTQKNAAICFSNDKGFKDCELAYCAEKFLKLSSK
jgi:hypothetical protein